MTEQGFPRQSNALQGSLAFWGGLALLLLAALIAYLITLDNGLRPGELAGGDLITHQYAQVLGRPSNAPGYPLYTMGGWLWFHGLRSLFGAEANATAILSSYSTAWALIALALLYVLIVDLTGAWWLGVLCAAFYAVTYFFWYYAASTEQYTSAVAHTLAIAWLAFRWEDRVEREAPAASARWTPSDGYLLALAFLCGLTLAHLVTVAFIVPPLLWFIVRREPGLLRRPRLMAAAAGAALLPLLSYLFIYVRGAQHPEWRGAEQWPSTWAWFWDFVSTQQGRDELTWSLTPLWTDEFPALIWQELTWVVVAGGLVGLALLPRRRGIFLGATLLIYLAFSFVDRLGNWFQVVMPAYALVVVSFSVFAAWFRQRLERSWGVGPAIAVTASLLLVLVGLRTAWSLPEANQRNQADDTGLSPAQAILADVPSTGSAVMGTYTETLSLNYLTEIQQQRPDVQPVDSARARRVLAAGAPTLYVTRAALPTFRAEVSQQASLSSAGATLISASTAPQATMPAWAQAVAQPVGDSLSLIGVAVQPVQPDGEDNERVRLYWQADAAVEHDWAISLRPTGDGAPLQSEEGRIVQVDLPHPVHGFYPTSQWSPGELVADDYVIPREAAAQMNGLQIVVYRTLPTGEFENLAVLEVPLAGRP